MSAGPAERAREIVDKITRARQGGQRWTMCVPVQPDDTDVVLADALDAAAVVVAAQAAQMEELVAKFQDARRLLTAFETEGFDAAVEERVRQYHDSACSYQHERDAAQAEAAQTRALREALERLLRDEAHPVMGDLAREAARAALADAPREAPHAAP